MERKRENSTPPPNLGIMYFSLIHGSNLPYVSFTSGETRVLCTGECYHVCFG